MEQYGEIYLQQNLENKDNRKPAFQPKIDGALHCIPKKKARIKETKIKFTSTYAPSLSLPGKRKRYYLLLQHKGAKLI